MSYCRFSSDDFQCDVYVYGDCNGGITTHVAGNRSVGSTPRPHEPDFMESTSEEWLKAHQALMAWMAASERVAIGLPHDGERFNHATPCECADNLERLKAMGYIVPQYAIDALREEAKEEVSTG